ncbi:MAG: hypothetical protein KatS3mg108_1787 [Isosphaeraceae bacterium]|jgi:mono/diheme cytochrome c family protein|nr:MAG: hypothetical protein KatS3mg108_1787 [Isosphaeraceae bacterium]
MAILCVIGVTLLGATLFWAAWALAAPVPPPIQAERPQSEPLVPVAVRWVDERRIAVALREGRELAIVDVESAAIERRIRLPFRPATLLDGGEGGWWVGGQDGELAMIDQGGSIQWIEDLGAGPVQMARLADGRWAAVARWERQAAILEPRSGSRRRIALPFEPGEVIGLLDGRLVVSDAFRGQFAVLDPNADPTRIQRLSVEGGGLRGLSLTPDGTELLYASMVSSGTIPLTATNLDWGLVLSSKLSALRIPEDLASQGRAEPLRLTLDGSGHGAADPIALAQSPDGRWIYIACRGSHQVIEIDRELGVPPSDGRRALGHRHRLRVVEVGRNPTALDRSPQGRLATADLMSDSITILAPRPLRLERTIRLTDVSTRRTPELRGEALFLDAQASMDRWMSCASCHIDGHTNGLRFDTLGDGSHGSPKDTPTLLGVGSTAPYGWTGRFATLDEQVEHSLRTTLHGPPPWPDDRADLVAYLESLAPPPRLPVTRPDLVEQGEALFVRHLCSGCHWPPSYASRPLREVGTAAPGQSFSVPSLRGVGRTPPYLHDGSADTLEELLQRHHPECSEPLDEPQRAALAAFLESL